MLDIVGVDLVQSAIPRAGGILGRHDPLGVIDLELRQVLRGALLGLEPAGRCTVEEQEDDRACGEDKAMPIAEKREQPEPFHDIFGASQDA